MFAPLIALAAAAAAAAAASPLAELPGIWQGTVGDLPVRACFARRVSGSFGAYYYLSRQQLIPLEAVEGASSTFQEGGGAVSNGPRWAIERADAAQLTARWTGGGRTLAVRLSRVARAEGNQSPCGSVAFHQPRLTGVRTRTAHAMKDGISFTRITLDHGARFAVNVATFALDGPGAAVRRINATLAGPLTGNPPLWFDCIRAPLEDSPYEGDFDESIEPAMISSRLMSVVQQDDTNCGGAHPNAGRTYRTFDLATGREIDLHDWLSAGAVGRQGTAGSEDEIKTLRPAFRRFILTGWHAGQADCAGVIRDQEYWNIGLTRTGLVFSPDLPHVVQACGEEFTLSFARLRSFLTQDAEAKLRALQAERPVRGARPAR
jgi:hypothetical protein